MSEREHYEPGVPCWVETLQPDPRAAGAFYSSLLGWDIVGSGVDRGENEYLVGRLRGRDVAGIVPLPPMTTPPPAPAWATHVRVDAIERAFERVGAAGGTVVFGPFDAPPAGRLGVVADPAGAVLCLWEPERREGAQLVNEAGAWAMSSLSTPDPDGAIAFYGEVFGWTTEPFAIGDETMTLFRLPGYVGGEPAQPVSREVVAAMTAAPSDDAPPAWHVDFWVDDVEATAAAAAELGGAVLQAPSGSSVDATAVLADPHGAAFAVSRVPHG